MVMFLQILGEAAIIVAVGAFILGPVAAPIGSAWADEDPMAAGCPCGAHCLAPAPSYCPDKTPPLCAGGNCNHPSQYCIDNNYTCQCSCGTFGGATCVCR